MDISGRPRGPAPPQGTQRPFIRPSQMGNNSNPFTQANGSGSTQRFPRPGASNTSPENRSLSPDPYARGGKFYRPSSTTLSDTDSDREKENESLRIQLAAMRNEMQKKEDDRQREREERQKVEYELARLKGQQPHADPRTQEQAATRQFVQQWTQGTHNRPQLNNTQSTMTGLANQFQRLAVDPVNNVLQNLGATAKAITETKPIGRLHLAPAEEQHIKAISERTEKDAQHLDTQASVIAALQILNTQGQFTPIIEHMSNTAQQSAAQLLSTKQQITKVTNLANRFTVTVPKPLIEPAPYGFVRDREVLDLRHIDKRVPHFDPDKDPNRCFAKFMHELNKVAKGQYLQEHNWFAIFQNLLRGEARDEFNTCQENDYSIEQTVEYLGKLYTRTKTIEDDKRELETFARKPNEDINRVMARYSSKVQKLQHLYDSAAFPAILEAKLQTGLFALITPKTKAYLEIESNKATMAGAPFTVESLIQLANTYEKSYNEVPTMTLTCGTNSVDLQRKITQQSSTIKSLEKTNNQTAEVAKKLEDLLQVASTSFKRDRSADKRSTSSKPAYRSQSKDRTSSNQDVVMTDVSQPQGSQYPDNKARADSDKGRKEKQRLKEEYEKKKKSGWTPSQQYGNSSNQTDYSRGRSLTPGRSNQRSASNSSQRSDGRQSRSNSAGSGKEAGSTQVSVDIWHKSNYLTCTVCSLDHPPYKQLCPAAGNQ